MLLFKTFLFGTWFEIWVNLTFLIFRANQTSTLISPLSKPKYSQIFLVKLVIELADLFPSTNLLLYSQRGTFWHKPSGNGILDPCLELGTKFVKLSNFILEQKTPLMKGYVFNHKN